MSHWGGQERNPNVEQRWHCWQEEQLQARSEQHILGCREGWRLLLELDGFGRAAAGLGDNLEHPSAPGRKEEGTWGSSRQHLNSLGDVVFIMGEGPEDRLPSRASIHRLSVFSSSLHSVRVLLQLRKGPSPGDQPQRFLLNSQGMFHPSNCVSPGNFPAAVLSLGSPRVQLICSIWGQDRDRSA